MTQDAQAAAPAGEGSATPMHDDILRQPQLLAALLERRGEVEGFAQSHLAPGANGRLHAYGSGDGWFAARAALAGQSAGGRPAQAWGSMDFLLGVAPGLSAEDRVLGITMSGGVDRSLQSAEAALAHGPIAALLTNRDGGRVGALGLPRFELGIEDVGKFLCGTSSYTATVLALSLACDAAPLPGALASALPDLPAMIARADAQAREIAQATSGGLDGIRILGTGTAVATADYGAAKMVEVTTVNAWSDELEEFAHRQYWALKRGEVVVLLPHDARAARFATASAEALNRLGIATVSVESGDTPVPDATHRIAVPGPAAALPITQAIALQLLAYRLGRANGTDPDRRLHLKDDTRKFTVSRLLTRRSLVGTGE
ncbi:SIS domain-containing protein [Oceaniglobus roseus]|uniref:SIS domain-containing protein n=1 Tax=Oceaniglobus roseus TaxID=1737570 RepID=UPI000C7EDF7A|nr:SIS domain-containing protein [Kandeliimicrobium roseum]